MPDSTVRRYMRRPLEVAAIRYDGANERDLYTLLGSYFGAFKSAPQVLTRHGWTPIRVGQVVLLGPGGVVEVMDGAEFDAQYVEESGRA